MDLILVHALLFFIEEISFLLFPLILFRFPIRERIFHITGIAFSIVLVSFVVRMFLNNSYSVFVLVIFVLLILYFYTRNYITAIVITATGYILHTTITALMVGTLMLISKQSVSTVVATPLYQFVIPGMTSVIMLLCSLIVYRKNWQLNIPSGKTPLGKQTQNLMAAFSVAGLVMMCQTITVFFVPDDKTYIYPVLFLGIIGLFLMFFLILRNVKIMQRQEKLEEEKMVLENLRSHSDEIISITKDFRSQMETIRQLTMFQSKESILVYLEHLLEERTFIQSSIEIHEPILQAFLQKERHIMQSFGIALLIKCEGHYYTPASISAYQLIRILKELLNSTVDALKQEDVKTLILSIKSTSEEISFEVHCDMLYEPLLSPNIGTYGGKTSISRNETIKHTKVTITFPRY
ncbi:hypothetical protein P4S84_00760 [Aneurinibacillus aneurinilyticus]|uniref:Sensor histidine kinase NatK C-terminal domain-containing protein n=4 Tax=Aneurinibacillus aneurinilyticus TaxID=1391 RepID=U1WX77_ANEAE|nr:hypothetical protein [Aneurinibacillus aneurinilyticus]ERI07265.1 hypothetical protein HMPREF0083_04640 [Aneurinibacillus aneurinilyticus ATCC 12856]MED0730422.1 hypothetical protein [Aneurinibacillus aneurinilyticus]MED0739154.1 hypothetical protein [Aneurinibacillus aneurinilyticus]